MKKMILFLIWLWIITSGIVYFSNIWEYMKNKLLLKKDNNQKNITFPTLNQKKQEITDFKEFVNVFFKLSSNTVSNLLNTHKTTYVSRIFLSLNRPITVDEVTYNYEKGKFTTKTKRYQLKKYWNIVTFKIKRWNRKAYNNTNWLLYYSDLTKWLDRWWLSIFIKTDNALTVNVKINKDNIDKKIVETVKKIEQIK